MKKEYFDIEQIDRYLEKQMSGEELEQYEIGLSQSEALRTEVSAYQQIIEGLYDLNSDTFEQKINQWEGEWTAAKVDDTELIEWYVTEALEAKGNQIVEDQIAKDTVFAKAVKDQQTLLEGLAMVNSENFIQQLEDTTATKGNKQTGSPLQVVSKRSNRGILRRLAATFLLIIGIGSILYWYANQNYNSTSITAGLHEAPWDEQILGENEVEENVLLPQFTSAHQLMEKQRYDEAFLAFNRLLEEVDKAQMDNFNRQYFTEEAEWNRLLAAQAMRTPPLNIEQEAERIANLNGHSKQKKAIELLDSMHSFWYRIAN